MAAHEGCDLPAKIAGGRTLTESHGTPRPHKGGKDEIIREAPDCLLRPTDLCIQNGVGHLEQYRYASLNDGDTF